MAVAVDAHVQLEIATFEAFDDPQEEEVGDDNAPADDEEESLPPKPIGERHKRHATSRMDCVREVWMKLGVPFL